MRKLCWACIAAGVAVLGLCQAANFACRYPDSRVARCAAGVYFAGMHLLPTSLIHSSTGSDDAEEGIEIPTDPEPIAVESSSVESATVEPIGHAEPGREYTGSGNGR